jgi:prepilin-type processing-associated H-X9-DG protein
MSNTSQKQAGDRMGFTLTELLVLVGVGAILSGVLVADFSQVRLKLLQQACAANLKQWGMAFSLYAQDYNGNLFMQQTTFAWDDTSGTVEGKTVTNVYLRYLGGGNYVTTIRTLRICPYVAATVPNFSFHTYSMVEPLAIGLEGIRTYQSVTEANEGSPYSDTEWITLNTVPYPSQFLLLVDGSSQFVHANGSIGSGPSGLAADANGIPAGDTTRAIDRHGGGVNCLFADQHVSWITYSNLVQQDTVPCCGTVPNPWFAQN